MERGTRSEACEVLHSHGITVRVLALEGIWGAESILSHDRPTSTNMYMYVRTKADTPNISLFIPRVVGI
jgi:hypothetical protein